MKVKVLDKVIENPIEVKRFLEKYNVYFEFWEPDARDGNEPLEIYNHQINSLKTKFNYVSADCCVLNGSNPNLDNILKPFMKEHHHTDDEVRFTVDGEGIFGINPEDGTEFEIHVQKGDLIMIPANVRHWFKLTENKNICCIRIFKENPKWEAIY